MKLVQFNKFCKALPGTTHVVQWGNCDVWKVAEKVFAIGGFDEEEGEEYYTFKVTPEAYDILQDEPGLRPAPYLASRGLKWIQHYEKPGLSDKQLEQYLQDSYKIVLSGVSKKKLKELGLNYRAILGLD